jgi:uncharacterized membrane protein YdjX (TVP38/TMEM64 family)
LGLIILGSLRLLPEGAPLNKRLTFRILFLLLFISLSFYIFIHFDLYLFFKDKHKLLNFIKSYHPYDELIFILLQIVQVVAAPIPGELTGLIGGYLFGPFLGTVYSTIGLTLGSWIAFMLARFFGEPLLEIVVKKEVFEKFDHFMEHQGIVVSLILFLVPGFPKDYLCYIIGVSRIPTWTFIISFHNRPPARHHNAFFHWILCRQWTISFFNLPYRGRYNYFYRSLLLSR